MQKEKEGVSTAPDTLLPLQYFSDPGSVTSGERRLWLEVLRDAIECIQKYFLARDRRSRRLYKEARAWLNSYEFEVGTFLFVCEATNLNPEYLRRVISQWEAKQLKKQLKLEVIPIGRSILQKSP